MQEWIQSMTYDFDKVYDRRGTNSLKWDCAKDRHHSEDELPLWVAEAFKKENYVIQYVTYSPEGAGEIRAITVEDIILEVSCDGQ